MPWVRAGVGAVATQANTRTAYGDELLDLLARGVSPDSALRLAVARDSGAASRQVGVVARDGRAELTVQAAIAWLSFTMMQSPRYWALVQISHTSPGATRALRTLNGTRAYSRGPVTVCDSPRKPGPL